jgi:hypothetical protein
VRAPRQDWMGSSDTGREAGPESWMLGLSVVSLVILLIVIITYYVGGQP